jgi:hypothetical protein
MTIALNLLWKAATARYARLRVLLALGAASLPALGPALAQQDPCAKFSCNLSHQRALCAESPPSLAAGREATSAPLLASDRPYELQLGPQAQVAMLLPPGKKTLIDGAYAALARLQVRQCEVYAICVEQPFWIAVVADGKMIDTAHFQGRARCAAPHKIVHYSLPADRELVLQFSAAAEPHLRLTITKMD